MKKRFSQPVTFISRSLFWSVLLYMACMAVINWDEMTSHFRKQHTNIVRIEPAIPNIPEVVTIAPSPQINDDANHSVLSSASKIIIEQVSKAIIGSHK